MRKQRISARKLYLKYDISALIDYLEIPEYEYEDDDDFNDSRKLERLAELVIKKLDKLLESKQDKKSRIDSYFICIFDSEWSSSCYQIHCLLILNKKVTISLEKLTKLSLGMGDRRGVGFREIVVDKGQYRNLGSKKEINMICEGLNERCKNDGYNKANWNLGKGSKKKLENLLEKNQKQDLFVKKESFLSKVLQYFFPGVGFWDRLLIFVMNVIMISVAVITIVMYCF